MKKGRSWRGYERYIFGKRIRMVKTLLLVPRKSLGLFSILREGPGP